MASADTASSSLRCPWYGIDSHVHSSPAEWVALVENEVPGRGVALGPTETGELTARGGGMPFKYSFRNPTFDVGNMVVETVRRS